MDTTPTVASEFGIGSSLGSKRGLRIIYIRASTMLRSAEVTRKHSLTLGYLKFDRTHEPQICLVRLAENPGGAAGSEAHVTATLER